LGDRTPVAPGPGDRGIFENFQNGHIFLKFLFFLYKKEKDATGHSDARLGLH
jgi:hypothetical protein